VHGRQTEGIAAAHQRGGQSGVGRGQGQGRGGGRGGGQALMGEGAWDPEDGKFHALARGD